MPNNIMNDESTLLALAERVEQATGPLFVLDVDIAKAVGRYAHNRRTPAYTASLDAAMSLAGEYTYIEFRRFDDGTFGCEIEAIGVKVATISATASTQVLALLSCRLRAIAQTTGSKQ